MLVRGVVGSIPNSPDTNTIDFGDNCIGSISSASFTLTNLGSKPITLTHENFYMKHNLNFTIGKTSFPITILPDDTANVIIYYAPTSSRSTIKNRLKIDYDTLFITTECNSFAIFLQGTPTPNNSFIVGQCNTPIRLVSDTIDIRTYSPVISPNPLSTKNDIIILTFAVTYDDNVEIKIADENGKIVNDVLNTFLQKGIYEIPICINDVSDGVYFIGLITKSDAR